MTNNLKILPYHDAPGWDAYVADHPKGCVFHTSPFLQSLDATRNHETYAVAAVDSQGNIVAVLSSVKISTLSGMASRFTSRSIMYAEPICDDSSLGVAGLKHLISAHARQHAGKILFTETRPQFASGPEREALTESGHEYLGYRNYELRLTDSPDTIFAAFDKKNRSDIRRSLKRGVEIETVTDPLAKLDVFYSLLQHSYSRSNVPLADKGLFQAVFERLPADQVILKLANYEGQTRFTTCCLVSNGRMFYWYGGGERIQGISANACLLWDTIREAAEADQTMFDFGGAGWEGEDYGPGKFKSQFGADAVAYGRYRRANSKLTMHVAERAYTLMRRFLSPAVKTKSDSIAAAS